MNTNTPRFITASKLLKEYVDSNNNEFETHFSCLYESMQKYLDEAGYMFYDA